MHRVRAAALHFAGLSAAAFAALLACGAVSATELYKWTDDKGVVHYTDTPPPKGKDATQRMRLKSEATPKADAAADANNKSAASTPASGPAPDTVENRRRACEQAKITLDLLRSESPVADSTDGKPLDAAQRADRTALTERTVALYCGNPS